jgi:hypothetical protein
MPSARICFCPACCWLSAASWSLIWLTISPMLGVGVFFFSCCASRVSLNMPLNIPVCLPLLGVARVSDTGPGGEQEQQAGVLARLYLTPLVRVEDGEQPGAPGD